MRIMNVANIAQITKREGLFQKIEKPYRERRERERELIINLLLFLLILSWCYKSYNC